MNPLRIVHVTWVDSAGGGEWSDHDAVVSEETITLTHSIGIPVKENKNLILLAQSFDPGTDSLHNYITIPRVAVNKVRTLCRLKIPTLPL